jgi:hypothetical protein
LRKHSSNLYTVLEYDVDQLVLTAVRDNVTGDYLTYEEMKESASKFGVPVTSVLPSSERQATIQEFMDTVKQREGIEGYILKFEHDGGTMYKLKSKCFTLFLLTKLVS